MPTANAAQGAFGTQTPFDLDFYAQSHTCQDLALEPRYNNASSYDATNSNVAPATYAYGKSNESSPAFDLSALWAQN